MLRTKGIAFLETLTVHHVPGPLHGLYPLPVESFLLGRTRGGLTLMATKLSTGMGLVFRKSKV